MCKLTREGEGAGIVGFGKTRGDPQIAEIRVMPNLRWKGQSGSLPELFNARQPNSALLTDAFSSLRCAYGAVKRERSVARWQHRGVIE